MKLEPIYTEKTECRDCYKCVRVCPVKAIQVQNGSAVVAHDRCIFCGKCVDVCPAHAKKIRNDVSRVKQLIKEKDHVFVSLAPSFVTEFTGVEDNLLIALKNLGFSGVSETALGAEIVSMEVDNLLKDKDTQYLISSACPTVVEAVRKYYPEILPSVTELRSPLGAHSLMLRELYGENIGIVFIGPCISKKLEADRNVGLPDVALTFRELISWMSEQGIDLKRPETLLGTNADFMNDPLNSWYGLSSHNEKSSEPLEFLPFLAAKSTNYAQENGMIATLVAGDVELQDITTSISGTKEVLDSLIGLKTLSGEESKSLPLFFEMLSCDGGCINGPGCVGKTASVIKKVVNSRFTRKRLSMIEHMNRSQKVFSSSIQCTYDSSSLENKIPQKPAGYEIEQALRKLGKADDSERLDCGGCGYNSCKEFASAYLAHMAEPEMCVAKMRKQAQSKVDMLLRTLPMGVVIVNRDNRIIDCNAQFLNMFSEITYEAEDYELGKISGRDLKTFIDLDSDFAQVFTGSHSVRHQKYESSERIIEITLFSIDDRRMAGALFQDTTKITKNRDAVMRRAEDVIQKNLQSVQQIASLLGENAAETEIMLSSMIDVFESPGS